MTALAWWSRVVELQHSVSDLLGYASLSRGHSNALQSNVGSPSLHFLASLIIGRRFQFCIRSDAGGEKLKTSTAVWDISTMPLVG